MDVQSASSMKQQSTGKM